MARKGIYYLGRVITLGRLDKRGLIEALTNPQPVTKRGHAWTFIDVKEYKDGNDHYVYGRLSKYSPDAEVTIVDPKRRAEVRQQEPNLSISSSPFVYIPAHSGIAFLHVWNHIEPKIFINRFCSIVKETHRNFFVDCEIEPITDLRTFAVKLSKLEGIYCVSAKVFPPNPIFGSLWKPLKDYLESRRTERMSIQEESPESEPLNTELPTHVRKVADQTIDAPYRVKALPMGDAAILMAADGYGTGLVKGKQGDEMVVIKTSETIRNFTFDKEPDPRNLYKMALRILESIKEERHMDH